MAHRELLHLWQHAVVPLHGLDALPRRSLPPAEANPQHLRPFRHISANRRNLHALLARQPAGRLGLVVVRGHLGTGDGRDSAQGMVGEAFFHPVDGAVPSDGLARPDCIQADASEGPAQWTPLVAGWRRVLHGGCRVLRVEETPVPSRYLAWIRFGRKYLPLFRGAVLGNFPDEGLIGTFTGLVSVTILLLRARGSRSFPPDSESSFKMHIHDSCQLLCQLSTLLCLDCGGEA